MALTLGDNFSYQGAKPLDARLKYADLATMKAVADATMYEGCMAYCEATGSTYQWKSSNTVDATLGKWREYGAEEMPSEDMADVITPLPSARPAYHKYSTEEQIVGEWIDGKPLYQKTLTGTISVDTDKTSKNTTLGNVSTDIDTVVSIDGIRVHENKSVFVSLSVASARTDNTVYICNLFVNNSTGNLVVEDNRLADDGRNLFATVKYTKTTD